MLVLIEHRCIFLPLQVMSLPKWSKQSLCSWISATLSNNCNLMRTHLTRLTPTSPTSTRSVRSSRKLVCMHDDFSLPCQHSLTHYHFLIQQFGAPNGLCSSIMESKHIKVVKDPYHCSYHNELLGQMLLTNQQLDKLDATHVDFSTCRMLKGLLL